MRFNNFARPLVADADKYALQGVRPPIRTNNSNYALRTLEYLRPSRLGKANRLLFREKATNAIKHEKRKYVGSAAGIAASSAVGVATGLSFIATGGISAAAFGLYTAASAAVSAARWKANERNVTKGEAQHNDKKVMNGLTHLLENGSLSKLAARGEKALVAAEKYDKEMEKWRHVHAMTKTCADSALLAWRYRYFEKRLKTCFYESEQLEQLNKFNRILKTTMSTTAGVLERLGKCVIQFCDAHPKRPSRYPDQFAHGRLSNDGLLQWGNWIRHQNMEIFHINKLVEEVSEGRRASGVGNFVQQLTPVYQKVPGYGQRGAENFAYYAVYDMGSSAIAHGILESNNAAFRGIMISGSAAAQGGMQLGASVTNAAVGSAADLLVTLLAEYINDRQNVKLFTGRSSGSQLSYSQRIWALRSILEYGRIKMLNHWYQDMTKNIEESGQIFQAMLANPKTLQVARHKPHKVIPELVKRLYKAHAALSKAQAILLFVDRMVCEINNCYLTLFNQGVEWEQQTQRWINRQMCYPHEHCKGTCYYQQHGQPVCPLG